MPPAGPTEFELTVKRLHLTPETYLASLELRRWCASHRNHRFVPEWLLKEWDLHVEVPYGDVA